MKPPLVPSFGTRFGTSRPDDSTDRYCPAFAKVGQRCRTTEASHVREISVGQPRKSSAEGR